MNENTNRGDIDVPQFMSNNQRKNNENKFRESLRYDVPERHVSQHSANNSYHPTRYTEVNHSVQRANNTRRNGKSPWNKRILLAAIGMALTLGSITLKHSGPDIPKIPPEAIEDQQLNNFIDSQTTEYLAKIQAMKEAYDKNPSNISDEELEKAYNEYAEIAKNSLDSKIANAYNHANPDTPLDADNILIAIPTQDDSSYRIGVGNNQYTYGSHIKFDKIISSSYLSKSLNKVVIDFCDVKTTEYKKLDHSDLSGTLSKLSKYAENLDNFSSSELLYSKSTNIKDSNFKEVKLPDDYFKTKDFNNLKEDYLSQYTGKENPNAVKNFVDNSER